MSTLLWVIQGLLAAVFLAAGAMKAFMPEDRLRAQPQMGWIEEAGMAQTRTAGYAEVLGALALVVPGLLGVATVLTPLAALGLAITMGLAVRLHLRRSEPFVPPLVLGVLAVVVAVGRVVEPL